MVKLLRNKTGNLRVHNIIGLFTKLKLNNNVILDIKLIIILQ